MGKKKFEVVENNILGWGLIYTSVDFMVLNILVSPSPSWHCVQMKGNKFGYSDKCEPIPPGTRRTRTPTPLKSAQRVSHGLALGARQEGEQGSQMHCLCTDDSVCKLHQGRHECSPL